MSRKLEIDMDTAERIALVSLQDHYDYLNEELRNHIENGSWMHPDDVKNNHHLIYCLEHVIKYYGG